MRSWLRTYRDEGAPEQHIAGEESREGSARSRAETLEAAGALSALIGEFRVYRLLRSRIASRAGGFVLLERAAGSWRWLALVAAFVSGAVGQAFALQALPHPPQPLLALPLFALGGLLLAIAHPWARQ